MRILISGGAGFIGSHLCKFLVSKGEEVICIDDLSSGSKDNVKELKKHKNFSFIGHDIIQPIEIKGKIDQIYHLASRASPPNYQSEPIHTLLTNSVGTNSLLKLAMEKDAALLYSSTSEVYGDPEEHPQKESYWGNVNPIGIRSCYDESKRFGEALCMAYYRKHKVKIKIVRIFNTYGPNMQHDDGRVITNFINQTLNNKPLTIFGDGKQTRSFCYVDDMVNGLVLMMNSKSIGPVNLGNPKERSVLQVAELIKKLTGSKSEMEFLPLPRDDPVRRKPDITLADELLGWKPQVGFEEGLLKTIEFFKNQ